MVKAAAVDDCPLSEIENGMLRRAIEHHVNRRKEIDRKRVSMVVTEVFVAVYRGRDGEVLHEHIEAAVERHMGIAS